MARITYDDQTAVAFKAVREVPRDGLGDWRAAVGVPARQGTAPPRCAGGRGDTQPGTQD
jgi:hypothetical protein